MDTFTYCLLLYIINVNFFRFNVNFFWTGANTKLTELQTESNRLSREKQELERKHASQPTNKDRKKFNRTTTEEFLYPEPMSSNSNANSAGMLKNWKFEI